MVDSSTPVKSLELKSVLVATDFTDASDRVLEHGIAIARHYQAILYVVYVVAPTGFNLVGPDAIELAAEASERDIDCLIKQLLDSGKLDGVEVRPIVLRGNVEEEVESFAQAHRVDLVVVSTHGRSGMERLLFGSVAQAIAKSCSCPVVTVGPHSRGPWLDNPAASKGPLLFAATFNRACARAVPYAISLADDFDRKLHVLHVTRPDRPHFPPKQSLTHDEAKASALAHLNRFILPRVNQNWEATVRVEPADPGDAILQEAMRIHAVTIIMGAPRDSIADLTTHLPWSITDKVNREAKCPVLTVGG